jgi:hypothetical protein
MFVYNLMIKLKSREGAAASKAALLEMDGKIKGMQSLSVQENCVEKTHDLLLTAEFDSRDSYDAYLKDPAHLAVGEKINAGIESIAILCFEKA